MSEIEVKALRWERVSPTTWLGHGISLCDYVVTTENGFFFTGDSEDSEPFDTLEAAQADCQSDYDARIRSALVSSPGKVAAPINWEDENDPAVKLFVSYDVEGYVEEYEFCADEGYYTPNESEKGLLIDAIYGVVSDIHEKLRALSVPLPEIEGGDKGDGWRTIDTAPKDETDILLSDCRVHGGFMTVASYEIVDGSEWVWHTNDGPSYHTEAFTHWRPLPAAPSASIEGETP